MLNDLSHSKGPVRPRFLQIRVKGTLKSQGSTKVRSGNGQNCILSMRGNQGSNYYRVLKGNQVSNGCFTISWEVFLYYRNDWVVIKLGCIRSSFKRLRASVQHSNKLVFPQQQSIPFIQQILSTCYRLITILGIEKT